MQPQMQTKHRLSGLFGFTIVWIGQIVSVLASGMTAFAMTIYMYQQTHSATAMGLVQVAFITPFLIMSPIAGVMVDRYNRKLMMMISDVAGGIATFSLFILYFTGHLQYWHLYIAVAVSGIGTTFQWPAYSAAISVMIPKEQYGRGVLAPLIAGALIPLVAIGGILLIDSITFATAILALAVVFIPQPPQTVEGIQSRGNFWNEASYGFKYIFARPSLLGLQLIFFFGNLFSGISFTVLAPMILARTQQNSVVLGSVESAGAVGMVIGGIIMSTWGGFKKRVHGVLLGWSISSFFNAFLLSFGRGLPIWAPMMLLGGLFGPLINGSNQAIWQAKVAPDVQGRVFSARRLIAWFTNPISPIIGGTLADFVLEPAMKNPDSGLARIFSPLFGFGPGSGMSLLIFICGLIMMLVGISGYSVPAIRNAESILPDYEAVPKVEPVLA
jgi:MFS transporter, DHA3 family, macrolide efflux protein